MKNALRSLVREIKRRPLPWLAHGALYRANTNLRAVQQSAFALYMATEVPGLEHDFARDVDEAEAEGSRLIGARPCGEVHGRGGVFPHEELLIPAHEFACPECGAQL